MNKLFKKIKDTASNFLRNVGRGIRTGVRNVFSTRKKEEEAIDWLSKSIEDIFDDHETKLKGKHRTDYTKDKIKRDAGITDSDIDDIALATAGGDEGRAEHHKRVSGRTLQQAKIHRASSFMIGGMYMYAYDAKYKEKLPYYDTFPLMIVIKHYNNGFLGLNLHYVPSDMRYDILTAIFRIAQRSGNERQYMAITYDMLKQLSNRTGWKHCIKRYLNSNVRSAIYEVDPEDWEQVIYLPHNAFVSEKGGHRRKVQNIEVWRDIK